MMKGIVVVVMMFMLTPESKAQFLGGFFNQKSTQLRRLAEQIAALKVYGGYIEKGYKVANTGLSVIRDIKNGDFSIHSSFFASLKAVNPNIVKYTRVPEILSRQMDLFLYLRQVRRLAQRSGMYSEEDLLFIQKAFNRLILLTSTLLNDLLLWSKAGIDMKDDERIRRIEHTHEQLLQISVAARKFSEQVSFGAFLKSKELSDIRSGKWLNGL